MGLSLERCPLNGIVLIREVFFNGIVLIREVFFNGIVLIREGLL